MQTTSKLTISEDKRHPLIKAVENSALTELADLLEKKHDQAIAKEAFAKAILNHRFQAAQLFLKHHYDLNALTFKKDSHSFSIFQLAFNKKNFQACRFLIEHGFNLDIADDILNQIEPTPEIEALKSIIQDMRSFGNLLVKKNKLKYYRARLQQALNNDAPGEASYVKKVLGNFPKVHENFDFISLAVKLKKYNVLKEIAKFINADDIDENGHNHLMFAVLSGDLDMVKFLYQNNCTGNDFVVFVQRNNKGETALDIAKQCGFMAIVNFLSEKQREEEANSQYAAATLQLPATRELKQTDFIYNDDLTARGRLLVFDHFVKKYRPDALAIYVRGNNASAIGNELIRIIKSFVESNSEEAFIFTDENTDSDLEVSDHSDFIQLAKHKGITYIFFMNSNREQGATMIREIVAGAIKLICPEIIQNIVFGENDTNQQTSGGVCYYHALLNARVALLNPLQPTEVLDKHVLMELVDHTVKCFKFRIPARFMASMQSYDRFTQYVAENKAENLARVTDGRNPPVSFYQYVHRVLEGYGVSSPVMVKNRHYDPMNKESKEPEMIPKNLTVLFYKAKFIQSTVPKILKRLHEQEQGPSEEPPQKKLRTCISSRDSKNYVVDHLTKELGHVDQLREKQKLFREKQKASMKKWAESETGFEGTFFSPEFMFSVANGETLLDPSSVILPSNATAC